MHSTLICGQQESGPALDAVTPDYAWLSGMPATSKLLVAVCQLQMLSLAVTWRAVAWSAFFGVESLYARELGLDEI